MSPGGGTPRPLLEARGLAKRFGGIRAVIDGNLTVERSEMVGLVGPNGCGKSTMLNIISGSLRPDQGEILLDGEHLPLGHQRRVQRRGVFLVAQELALAPEDTVWQSIVLGAEPRRGGVIRRRAARQVAADALAQLGLDLPLDSAVAKLTPVERRLVMIARGAAQPGARLLILDEPTAGLPDSDAIRVLAAMRSLVEAERSIILVSHHIEEVASNCRRVTMMRDGRTTRTFAADEVSKSAIVDELLSGVDAELSAEQQAPAELGEVVARMVDVRGRYLDGVSLTVSRGEVVGLAGILGSGTGEVIEMLTGQARPSEGTVEVGPAGITPKAPHQVLGAGVGFVSGDRSSLVVPGMTVAEHVALPTLDSMAIGGVVVSRRRQRDSVAKALEKLAVKGDQGAPMTSLSGGNQQRALMSRWTDAEADLMVVDQPTVGVDIKGRIQLLAVLRDLARDCGVLLVAEPEELSATCDRVICLQRGRIKAELTGVHAATEARILDLIA